MSERAHNTLERILAETREALERRKRERDTPPGAPGAVASDTAPVRAGRAVDGAFHAALSAPGIGVIAEFKRRSPSAGPLREGAELAQMIDAYARGGAVSVSVLTEEANFDGSLEDLRAARELCTLPLLRKDFIVDELQLHEARDAGADAVLLIVAALEQAALERLHAAARCLALDVLVEVHDRSELQRALAAGAQIIGVNNRDLRDFSVDLARTEALLGEIPAGVRVVSESGIRAQEQLERLAERGVDAVLVGEMLMRSRDPAAALLELRGAERTRAERTPGEWTRAERTPGERTPGERTPAERTPGAGGARSL